METQKNSNKDESVFKAIKDRYFHNLGWKILALAIAVVVWWVIINIDDPLVKKNFNNVEVELRNADTLVENGFIYDVISGSKINFTVIAPESVINELKSSDFSIYADLAQLNPLTDSAAIEISCIKDDAKELITDISTKTQVVKLSIDNKESADIPVEISVTGTPAADYVIGDQSLSQTRIRVTGAATVVESIVKAVISYDVSDMTSSVYEKIVPVFYDENGKIVNTTGLQISRNSITLNVEILPTKWVDVNLVPSGEVADGFKMTGYDRNILQVKLAGTRSNLDNITSVNIPSDAIDINGIEEDTQYTVNIESYLSGSYKIVSETKDLIVDIYVEPLYIKTFKVPSNSLRIENLAEKLDVEIKDSYIKVDIKAIEEILEGFNLDALNAYIDLQGLDEGRYNVVVQMSEGESFDVVGTYTVKVDVFNKETGKVEESDEENESSEEDFH